MNASRTATSSCKTTAPSSRGARMPRRRTLLVIRGDHVDAHPLPLAGEVAIGRGAEVDIRIDDPSMSRLHLAVSLAPGSIAVTDRGSANGTLLRGVKLPVGVPVEVSPNESFAAGDVVLAVQEVGAHLGGAPLRGPSLRPSGGTESGREPIVLDVAMTQLYALAARVARGTIGVLLTGDTGTGKEVLCEYLHRSSGRAAKALIRINCAALADSLAESELFGHDRGAFTGAHADRAGLIEAAAGGTVFLDEVGELSPALQAKLLRVLEDRAVTRVGATTARAIDVRFVAATNRDLEAEVEAGRFRRDLFFRLAGVVLAIPPLVERPDEIVALARRFASDAAAALGRGAPVLDAGAITALRAHAWPGNVRELRNVVERAVLVVSGERIDAAALGLGRVSPGSRPPATTTAPAPPHAPVLGTEIADLEKQRILAALDACAGNQTRAAAQLGMPLRTFVKRLTAYGVARPRKPRAGTP